MIQNKININKLPGSHTRITSRWQHIEVDIMHIVTVGRGVVVIVVGMSDRVWKFVMMIMMLCKLTDYDTKCELTAIILILINLMC